MKSLIVLLVLSFSVFAQDPDLFRYKKPAGVLEETLLKSDKHHDHYIRRLLGYHPITNAEIIINVHLFLSKTEGKRPLTVMVPLSDNVGLKEKYAVEQFTKRGAHVAIVTPIMDPSSLNLPTTEFQESYLAAIASIRSVVDDMSAHRKVDESKIMLWASSFGAILGATAFSIDERFKTSILICGGGKLPNIMANSLQRNVVKYRKQRMKEEDLNRDDFRKKLRDHFEADPLKFAGRRSSDEVFMVLAGMDASVPVQYQHSLWKAFGKPKMRLHPFATHSMALVLSHTIDADNYAKMLLERVEQN